MPNFYVINFRGVKISPDFLSVDSCISWLKYRGYTLQDVIHDEHVIVKQTLYTHEELPPCVFSLLWDGDKA